MIILNFFIIKFFKKKNIKKTKFIFLQVKMQIII